MEICLWGISFKTELIDRVINASGVTLEFIVRVSLFERVIETLVLLISNRTTHSPSHLSLSQTFLAHEPSIQFRSRIIDISHFLDASSNPCLITRSSPRRVSNSQTVDSIIARLRNIARPRKFPLTNYEQDTLPASKHVSCDI